MSPRSTKDLHRSAESVSGTRSPSIRRLVRASLREDLGRRGDITSKAIRLPDGPALGRILVRDPVVCSGLDVAVEVFRSLDRRARVRLLSREGGRVKAGGCLMAVESTPSALLSGERVALNFLSHLCGIATLSARYVAAVRGTRAVILDTRKTTPLLRELEKRAVRAGGAMNHRMGLDAAIFIKDNHAAVAGSIRAAVERAKGRSDHEIIAEAENERDARTACQAGADIVLLDNMSVGKLRRIVGWIRLHHPGVRIEVSGGVTLKNVRALARTGVDRISVGALTHSVPHVDMHMTIRKNGS